jgi:integrase/recombinase XerD
VLPIWLIYGILLGGCVAGGVELLAVDRADVEAYARDLEQAGRARSTVARRLATLAGFYRYAVEEAALPRSPVAHVRRPSVAHDSQTLGLDRDEATRFLAAAETAPTGDHDAAPRPDLRATDALQR